MRTAWFAFIAVALCAVPAAPRAQTAAAAPQKSLGETIKDLDITYDSSNIIVNKDTNEIQKAEWDGNVNCKLGEAKLDAEHVDLVEAKGNHGRLLTAIAASPAAPVIISQEDILAFCGKFVYDLDKGVSTLTDKPIVYRVDGDGNVAKSVGEEVIITQIENSFGVRTKGSGAVRGSTRSGIDANAEDLSPALKRRLLAHIQDTMRRAKEKAAAEKAAKEKAAQTTGTKTVAPAAPAGAAPKAGSGAVTSPVPKLKATPKPAEKAAVTPKPAAAPTPAPTLAPAVEQPAEPKTTPRPASSRKAEIEG